MIDELRKYIEDLFTEAPKTRAMYELREELMSNSTERYFDLIEDKVPEKEAFDIVVNSIGDVSQFFSASEGTRSVPLVDEKLVKKRALYKSIAIGLYILGFIFVIAMDEFTRFESVGMMGLLLFAAIATCILVYMNAAYPNYQKKDDTVVEEFKEWNSSSQKRKGIKSSVSLIIWTVVFVLYFLISFTTMAWHITWILFLVGVCAQAIANLLFYLNEK